MKKTLAIILLVLSLGLCCSLSAQTTMYDDSRYTIRSTMYGVGHANVLDTYLSPIEYTGIELRLSRENMRMTKLFDGNVSTQSFFQSHLAYTKNPTETSNTISGLANWNYGLYYQFRITENLKLLAGGVGDFNLGFVYNIRNSNNPSNAKAYINLAASGMAIYHFKIKRYPMVVRYQANLPLAGIMFSPHFQQSYYEIFTLGNTSGIVRFTSLHNQPSVRQMLSLDFPVSSSKLRVSYLCDIQQSEVNQIKSHMYSHAFMIGFVKMIYRVKDKTKRMQVY